MVDKNIDGLESDRDFIKMTTDMKKNDESINIPGYIMPEHKMAPNHPVQAQKNVMKRDQNGRYRSDHPVADGVKAAGMRGTQMAQSNSMGTAQTYGGQRTTKSNRRGAPSQK